MFKKTILTLILINFLLVAYFYTRPYSFYKVISIRSVQDFESHIQSDSINSDEYIIKTISQLPEKRGTVYSHNKEKRQKLFLEGYGNCSNQAVAMGSLLYDRNKKFQVIHLMPVFEFLEGGGHSLLQTTYNDSLMVFDLLGRSILRKDNHFITYKDIDSIAERTNKNKISLEILNSNRADVENYYNPDSNYFVIGIVPDEEYKKFYDFTRYLYVPEKETRITQAFFYSITTLFNKPPHIYIQEKDFYKLNQNKKFKLDRILSFGLVINTWLTLIVFFIAILLKLKARLNR